MLEVNAPIGNIFLDEEFNDLKEVNFEKLQISRIELGKKILRKKTNCGTDIGLKLDSGIKLRNGDILRNNGTKIIVEQLPEKVISLRLKTESINEMMILLGHIIGNRHRPISIQREEILFPIQAESEKEVFSKLFHNINKCIDMRVDERIFSPHSSADVHEH